MGNLVPDSVNSEPQVVDISSTSMLDGSKQDGNLKNYTLQKE